MKPAIEITVTGHTGSGKSTLIALIEQVLKDRHFAVDIDTPSHDRQSLSAYMLKEMSNECRATGKVIVIREVTGAPTASREARRPAECEQDAGGINTRQGPKTTTLDELKAATHSDIGARVFTVDDTQAIWPGSTTPPPAK